ncbi:DUF4249 domain-containing protein [Mucilaginibacter xinganensis]|uniref:DUF4249 domain-containing protein n=1 Tax=Mucilaginibacter xinganensis TaxID=1234841 RepID=A0A223P3M3_9SPHI|nr:DUF4249 domain-containing protein [Mucilaginibacter xinganensis]ASU36650.1 hypothetical protein MuYL_4767 [Mucilaginibacter xinganensis]
MKYQNFYIVFYASVVLVLSCKKPYSPPVTDTANNYLVVEGFINSGADSTMIKLNRTVKLSGNVNVNPELNAVVTVEGDDNTTSALREMPNGVYVSAGLNLNTTHKYRLRIKAAGGREYLSDFVPVVKAPPIDSITYKVQSDGVDINLNTHDVVTNTRYYRWEYDETWIFVSAFQSEYKSNGDTVLRRDLINDEIYTCWRTEHSTVITLGSSAKLSANLISDGPITFISRHSEKIKHKYSILIRQYALTKEAYDFWQILKKNTEQLGSIFDAQPSQLKGNIHAVDNALEPVIGFVSIGSFSVKRAFVDQRNLPAWIDPDDSGCKVNAYLYEYRDPVTGTTVNQVDQYINFNKATRGPIIPVEGIQPPGAPKLQGFSGSTPECVDCTLRGTNKQPGFWQ